MLGKKRQSLIKEGGGFRQKNTVDRGRFLGQKGHTCSVARGGGKGRVVFFRGKELRLKGKPGRDGNDRSDKSKNVREPDH